ncbi:MAG: hypothetical protein Alpg2KO_04610 [Alphaproteobacteria bacterium]
MTEAASAPVKLPPRPLETAISHAESGQWDEAIALFEHLHAERPDAKRIRLWLGYCLVESGADQKRGYTLMAPVVRFLAEEGELPVQTYSLPDEPLDAAITACANKDWKTATRILELMRANKPDAKLIGMWLGYALVEGNPERNPARVRGVKLMRRYVPHFDGQDIPPVQQYALTGSPIAKAIRDARNKHYPAAIRKLEMLAEERPENKRVKVWLGHSLIAGDLDPKGALKLMRGQEKVMAEEGLLPVKSYLGTLAALQPDRARAAYDRLLEKLPELREHFLSVDDDTALAKAYRAAWEQRNTDGTDLAVYYHLPFTGGTSFQRALNVVYPKRQRYNIKRRAGLVNMAKMARLGPGRMKALRYVHLHHPFPVDWRGREARYFTILRDPVSYFLSGHFKRRNRGQQAIMPDRSLLIEGGGLEEAVEFSAEHNLHDGLCRQLAILHPRFADSFAERYADPDSMIYTKFEDDLQYGPATADLSPDDLLDLANEVLSTQFWPAGVLSHMDASYYAIMAELGFPVIPRLPHAGISKRPPRDEIAESVKSRIAELNTADQALFDQHKATFETNQPELIAAVAADKADRA